jgi:hypothetical protein
MISTYDKAVFTSLIVNEYNYRQYAQLMLVEYVFQLRHCRCRRIAGSEINENTLASVFIQKM